jgi:hypothetical protein
MTEIENLIEEIRALRQELVEVKKTTARMDGHIDFVEGVYEIIKTPLHMLMSIVRYLPYSSNHEIKY